MSQTNQKPNNLELQPEFEPKKLKTWLWVLIAIIVTAILVGWVVWTYQKAIFEAERLALEQSVLNLEKQVQQDETADWQIYRNEEYGFEFRYPEDWEIRETNEDNQGCKYKMFPSDKDNCSVAAYNFDSGNDRCLDSICFNYDDKYLRNYTELITYLIESNYPFQSIVPNEIRSVTIGDRYAWRHIIVNTNGSFSYLYYIPVIDYTDDSHDYLVIYNNYLDSDYQQNMYAGVLSSLQFFDKQKESLGGGYFKDNNFVYFSNEAIRGVDILNFEVIDDNSRYAKDKNKIYYYGKIIDNADLETFEVIDKDSIYAKDKNNVYIGGEVLEGADPKTFKP